MALNFSDIGTIHMDSYAGHRGSAFYLVKVLFGTAADADFSLSNVTILYHSQRFILTRGTSILNLMLYSFYNANYAPCSMVVHR
jgi:hypothetical protein